MPDRIAEVERKTKETNIKISLNLDGSGSSRISTGMGFFDHMLDSFARHGLFDLEVSCEGDLQVDCHHSVEDVGIVLGEAFKKALGDKAGNKRFGNCILPMDDALVLCAVDLSGRPFFASDLKFNCQSLGDMESETVQEFFYAFSYAAGVNLHFVQHRGENGHHIAEAAFKSFARALSAAVNCEPRVAGVWSTKGTL